MFYSLHKSQAEKIKGLKCKYQLFSCKTSVMKTKIIYLLYCNLHNIKSLLLFVVNTKYQMLILSSASNKKVFLQQNKVILSWNNSKYIISNFRYVTGSLFPWRCWMNNIISIVSTSKLKLLIFKAEKLIWVLCGVQLIWCWGEGREAQILLVLIIAQIVWLCYKYFFTPQLGGPLSSSPYTLQAF